MAGRNAYPIPPGANPFEHLAHLAGQEAQPVDDPLIGMLWEKVGAPLMRLEGYETTYIFGEDELQAMKDDDWLVAGIDGLLFGSGRPPQLPRLQTGVNDTLWHVTDQRTHYAGERKHELHDEVAELEETAAGVVWVPATGDEYYAPRTITARAPEGSDTYWVAGEPIKICRRYNVSGAEDSRAFNELEWSAKQKAREDGYWDDTHYMLYPVQYFSSNTVVYSETKQGEIEQSISRILADPHYYNSYRNRSADSNEPLDKALMKVVFQAELLGVDGLQFVQHITSEKRRSTTIVKIGISRQDCEVINQGVAEAEAMPLENQKRNNHFRNLVKLLAPYDADLATTVSDHISKSSVQALALVDIAKTMETDERQQVVLERAKKLVLDDLGQGRGPALGKIFEATFELNKEFASTLLPLMSTVTRKRYEALLAVEAGQEPNATDKPKVLPEVAAVEGQERELTIAEALLEEYRKSDDHEMLVKALAAGGLIKDMRRRQQLFNEIADQLTNPSLPTPE
jgi:hypothetical protein